MKNACAQYLEGSSLGILWAAPVDGRAGTACAGHGFSLQHHPKTSCIFMFVCVWVIFGLQSEVNLKTLIYRLKKVSHPTSPVLFSLKYYLNCDFFCLLYSSLRISNVIIGFSLIFFISHQPSGFVHFPKEAEVLASLLPPLWKSTFESIVFA